MTRAMNCSMRRTGCVHSGPGTAEDSAWPFARSEEALAVTMANWPTNNNEPSDLNVYKGR